MVQKEIATLIKFLGVERFRPPRLDALMFGVAEFGFKLRYDALS